MLIITKASPSIISVILQIKFPPFSHRFTFKMAGDIERNRSLKEALFESLTAVLSPEQGVRAAGEEQVKALEVTEGMDYFPDSFK